MFLEQSYGIIPLDFKNGNWYVFLIQHSSARYWGFPKGHPNPGEEPKRAAERELFEETGLHVVNYIDDRMYTTNYQYIRNGKSIQKSCGYFAAIVSGTKVIQVEEVSGDIWLPIAEALDILTHRQNKEVLKTIRLCP